MNMFSITGLFAFVSSFCIGIIFLWKGKRQIGSVSLALTCLASSLWAFGMFKASTAISYADALFWVQIANSGTILAPAFFFHFVCESTSLGNKKLISWVYLLDGFFLICNFTSDSFVKIRFVFDQFYFMHCSWEENPLYLIFYLIFYWLILLYAFFLLLKYFSKITGIHRNQIKYFIIGCVVAWAGPEIMFLLVMGLPIYPLSNILLGIYPLIFAYAILRYRLMDIKVAFTRGAILLLVYAFIVGIPLALLILGKPYLVKYFQTQWFVPPLGLYTILALLGPYIYLRFQNKAEEKRMRQQVRLHQSLKAASKTTIEVQSIDKLSKIIPRYLLKLYKKLDNKIMHISMFLHDKDNKVYHMQSSVGEHKIPVDTLIREGSMLVKWFTVIRDRLVDEGVMRANDVEVLVYEDIDYWLNNPNVLRKPFKGLDKVLRELKRIMELYKASLILPSVYQKELLGFLVLGEKIPDPYSISDISTFSILANDSAMAFKAAQLFEDLKVAQASLIQSEKLNLLGQLASSMAHEINNPLAIISGNVQLLLMDETDESKKKFLQKISDQTERGYKIIHRLLNFSRLPKEEIKVIKVHEMIDETLELIGHKIKHGNIELIKEYNEVPEINGNPTQIQEVLLNLFVNGIQSMGEGGTLKITTAEVKHKVEVLITDTGKGIDEKDIQNIFDPFYTKGKENGTGLGLFVASQVMGLHKGTINVKSKVGQGTTFVLQFGLEKN
ncbi:MAG: hypothetical protein KJ915_08430 [Candidatus Omnitrophica bacterium]|nr:hypothetical protein [Candidatus Omnitrophota bacterium]